MVATGRLHRLDLSVVDPLLQGGVAATKNIGGFQGRQELKHNRPPANLQNTAFIAASSIRLYTIRRLVVLIAQGFSGFQRMRDPLLCFLFAAEGDEGFAFEVENVLFADQLWRGQRPAGKDVRKLAAYVCVIFRGITAAQHPVNGALPAGQTLYTKHLYRRSLIA